MKVIVERWGDCGAIRLPKILMSQLGLHPGDRLTLEIKEDKVLLTPPSHTSRLEALLAGITAENLHHTVDLGPRNGRELL